MGSAHAGADRPTCAAVAARACVRRSGSIAKASHLRGRARTPFCAVRTLRVVELRDAIPNRRLLRLAWVRRGHVVAGTSPARSRTSRRPGSRLHPSRRCGAWLGGTRSSRDLHCVRRRVERKEWLGPFAGPLIPAVQTGQQATDGAFAITV